MIFRRNDRDRGNPTDLLQRLRSLHDLLDRTTENTGEEGYVDHHERGRELTVEVGPVVRPESPDNPAAPFDDDVPLLMDVVTPEELAAPSAAATSAAPETGPAASPARPLTSDADVVRALAAFELAVSRHLGHDLDDVQNQAMRSAIRHSLTRMLAELETRWKDK